MPSHEIASCGSDRSFLLVASDGRLGSVTENSSPLTVYVLQVSGSDASTGFSCPEAPVANRMKTQTRYEARYMIASLIKIEVIFELHPHRDKFSVFDCRNKLDLFRRFN